jgi:Zn-dependent oligopeptidase
MIDKEGGTAELAPWDWSFYTERCAGQIHFDNPSSSRISS